MSAKNRGTTVVSQEFYPTPEYTIDSILSEIDFTQVQSFREPCKGGGAIYDKVNVPDKDYCELSEGLDYLKIDLPKVDLILTNPPFSLAKEFIEKAIGESGTVVMLQRVNFLGSKSRQPFWHKYPPTHLFVLSSRPKFIAKCPKKGCQNKDNYQIQIPPLRCVECDSTVRPASDATEYAWFVWDNRTSVIKRPPGVYSI